MTHKRFNFLSASVKMAETLAIPLGLINTFTGIMAGVWLAILGEWGLIGFGVLILLVSIFALISALTPGMFFAGPAAAFRKKGKKTLFYAFSCLTALYSNTVLSGWCVTIIYHFAKQADGSSIVPVLLWSYGIAIGPVLWISQKDIQSGDRSAMISTFFAQVACFLVILVNIFTRVSLQTVVIPFAAVMLVGQVIQFRIFSPAISTPILKPCIGPSE